MLIKVIPYTLISDKLYKIGMDEVIHHVVLPHECDDILREAHDGLVGGHFDEEMMSNKVLQAKL